MIPYHINKQIIQEQNFLQEPKKKSEVIKILLQTLQNLGYEQSLESLQKESGIALESEELKKFKQAILLGQWVKAINIIESIEPKMAEQKLLQAKFLIFQEKYLELLESKNVKEALSLMRGELSQTLKKLEMQSKMEQLATLVMHCSNPVELRQKSQWIGAGIESRKNLLNNIYQVSQPQSEMLPPNRLQSVIKQAKTYQIAQCQFHTGIKTDYSVIKDHQCLVSDIPLQPSYIDKSHKDEVWIAKFSPDGNLLGSIGKNCSLIVWGVKNNRLEKKWEANKIHKKEIHCLNWRQDSQYFATASADQTVKIWDPKKPRKYIMELKDHQEIVCSVVWHPINHNIYTAGIDQYILVWDSIKKRRITQIKSERNMEMHITNSGDKLITISATQPRIGIMNTITQKETNVILEKDTIISSYLSHDNNLLLVNISYKQPELKLWSLETFELLNRFNGFKQQSFMLRCCLGWKQELIVACGSEDGRIFLWHRFHNKVTKIIKCSKLQNSTVNCVSWNPKRPNMMVSAHDDHSIILWSNNKPQSHLSQSDGGMQTTDKKGFMQKVVNLLKKPFFQKYLGKSSGNLGQQSHIYSSSVQEQQGSMQNEDDEEQDQENDYEKENDIDEIDSFIQQQNQDGLSRIGINRFLIDEPSTIDIAVQALGHNQQHEEEEEIENDEEDENEEDNDNEDEICILDELSRL